MRLYLKIVLNFLIGLAIISCGKDEGETPTPSTENIPLPEGQSNLRVKEVFADSIIIEWDSIKNAQTYELSLNDDILSTSESLIYTFKDLSPATAYTIGITPLNSEGEEGKRENITATTLKKEVMIEEGNILLNPFITAPLAALVRIGGEDLSPEAVETIKVKVAGKSNEGVTINGTMYPQTDEFKMHFFNITEDKKFNQTVISHEDSVEIPVLGLYEGYNNAVEYEVETNTHIYKGAANIETKPLGTPWGHRLNIEVAIAKPDKMEPGDVTWNSGHGVFYSFMFDYTGALRWFNTARAKAELRILRNGNLLVRPPIGTSFGEYSFLGEELRAWNIPSGFRHHHDIYEMPSGSFLVAVDRLALRKEGYKTVEDCLLELDESGQIINYWDLFELMDIKNLKAVWRGSEPGDWFHMNGFWYDKTKDEIIISGGRGGMLKLSRNGENGKEINKNKEIVWLMPRFGQYDAYKNHGATKDHILTAVNASGDAYSRQHINHEDFHWTLYQHNPSIIPSDDGLLHFLIFNNYHGRYGRSAVVEYAVDEMNNTVKQVWQYGKDRPELFGNAQSGATWLPITNNRMMIPQLTTSPSVEVTAAGEVVFEYKMLLSRRIPCWYRGGRINLYPTAKARQ